MDNQTDPITVENTAKPDTSVIENEEMAAPETASEMIDTQTAPTQETVQAAPQTFAEQLEYPQAPTPAAEAKKKKPTWLIPVIIASVVLILAAGVYFFLIPELKYQSALSELEKGNYDIAKDAFTELGEYRDSEGQIKECDYRTAMDLFNAGKYDSAISVFGKLDGYADSRDMVLECGYRGAANSANSGDFKGAADVYYLILGYKDSRSRFYTNVENYIRRQAPTKIMKAVDTCSAAGTTVTVTEPSTFPDIFLYQKASYIKELRELWSERREGLMDIVFGDYGKVFNYLVIKDAEGHVLGSYTHDEYGHISYIYDMYND